MDKLKFPKLSSIVALIIIISTIIIAAYNFRSNNQFWDASAINCISIIVAVLVAYVFVKKQTNRRKQNELLLDLLLQLRTQISDTSAYDFSGQTKSEINMRKRSISNKVGLILENSSAFKKEDTEFISEKFQEYEQLIGNHISDLDYLIKSKEELLRPLTLMSDKLFSMAFNLFN